MLPLRGAEWAPNLLPQRARIAKELIHVRVNHPRAIRQRLDLAIDRLEALRFDKDSGEPPHKGAWNARVCEAPHRQLSDGLRGVTLVHKRTNVLRSHSNPRDVVAHKVAREARFEGREEGEQVEAIGKEVQRARWPVAYRRPILKQQRRVRPNARVAERIEAVASQRWLRSRASSQPTTGGRSCRLVPPRPVVLGDVAV